MANPIELQKHLAGMSYPARKNDVISCAKHNGADKELLDRLNNIPADPDRVTKEAF